MDNLHGQLAWERGSHARGVYPTQYTSCKGAARVKKHHKNNARVVRNLEERNVGTKGKNPKQGLTSAKDYIYIYVIMN